MNVMTMFLEVDRISRMRRKLVKGFSVVFCRQSRGRIGWEIYKATVGFQQQNHEIGRIADIMVSDLELEEFLHGQRIRI